MFLIEDRFKRLYQAIEAERAEEENFFKNLSNNKTYKERIKAGTLWYPVEVTQKFYTVGEFIELDVTPSSELSSPSFSNFKVGSGVVFIKNDEDKT